MCTTSKNLTYDFSCFKLNVIVNFTTKIKRDFLFFDQIDRKRDNELWSCVDVEIFFPKYCSPDSINFTKIYYFCNHLIS